jgi:hypothetical protein
MSVSALAHALDYQDDDEAGDAAVAAWSSGWLDSVRYGFRMFSVSFEQPTWRCQWIFQWISSFKIMKRWEILKSTSDWMVAPMPTC